MPSRTKKARSDADASERTWVRFGAMLRVDYAVEDRNTFSYTALLSAGDMVLRSARELEVGTAQQFQVALGGKDKPLALAGVVTSNDADGVRILFDDGQDGALKALRKFIEASFVV